MSEPRRLRGHKATATCCTASRVRPGVVATAGEATSQRLLQSYNYNKEEINQIACNSKSTFLASADDSGDVKGILTTSTILAVITGGLDSKLVMWDFSNGRPIKIVDFGLPEMKGSSMAQCFNPAFVHAIAVPDADMLDKSGNVCIVGRGDGAVDVINIESELAATRSKSTTKAHEGSQSTSKGSITTPGTEGKRLHLDYTLGGHVAAVSCVAFSLGERGKFIITGGNDKSVKVWECSRYLDVGQSGSNDNILHHNINLSKKVNWLCTTPTESENLVVCDTTKVVKSILFHRLEFQNNQFPLSREGHFWCRRSFPVRPCVASLLKRGLVSPEATFILSLTTFILSLR
ncbi:hypothetical protein GH714_003822 [Hevea brasiliensis]|uniref:Uncharacterized protein n=1 Tax=Hevea brasiliensis TaxID=3981 RepID=A0A6A6M766_HEVBR|nr:hypothetical protein GH714_003822 [Hevea brasiliensis]